MATVTPKSNVPLIYVPEQDGGEGAAGQTVLSADMWIPLELVANPQAVLRTAVVQTVNNRTGAVMQIQLARQERYHLVMSRHLHADWREKVQSWQEVDLSPTWDDVDFGDQINLRNAEQQAAWSKLQPARYGILNLACGKGKTVLALKKIADRRFPAIVIVNNEGLIDQWAERATQFLNLTEQEIGVVQGTKAQWDRPLVLAMIHTLANRAEQIPMEIRKRFGTVVFDEVHHLSATTFLKTAPLFFGGRYGLTATAEREDGLEGAYYAHVGEIFHSDLQGDLSATTYFKTTPFKLPPDAWQIMDRTGQFSVGKLYAYLAALPARNNIIISMALEAAESGRKVLVLTHSAEHPEALKNLFGPVGGAKNLTSGAISGKTPGAERAQIIRQSNVSFATFQVAREGLDVAALDTVIFATPFKAWGAFQQGKGRIERRYPGKKEPLVVVLEDKGIGPCWGMCRSLKSAIAQHGMRYVDLR
jgi:superfamily II DNA or RNA helicase